jgi:hypothetical protein
MHKYFDVLEAIAEGKSVEFSVDGGDNWQEMPPNGTLNPIAHHYMPWRVKQEFEKKESTFYYRIGMGYGIPIISYCDNPDHADIELTINLNTYQVTDRKFL